MDEKRLSRYIDSLNKGKKPKEHKNNRLQKKEQEEQILFETVRRVKSLGEVEYPKDTFQEQLIYSLTGGKPMEHKSERKKPILIYAVVAASILLFVTMYQFLPNKNTSIVSAMERAISEMKAYHGIIEFSETNGLGETITQAKREVWADKDGNYYVIDLEGTSKGLITGKNEKQKWQLIPEERIAYLLPTFPDVYSFSFELGNEIEDVTKAQTVKRVGIEELNGRKTTKLEVTPDGGESYFLWIDNKTDLPLQRVSPMQNAIQMKVTYNLIEFIDEIPGNLLAYTTPNGYKEVDKNTEQVAVSLEEAEILVGFYPVLLEQIPEGYTLSRIAIENQNSVVKLYYVQNEGTDTILFTQTKEVDEFLPASTAILGTINNKQAEIITAEAVKSIRWQENGMEYGIYGMIELDVLTEFAKGVSGGEVEIPTSSQRANEPKIKVEVNLSVEENEQKSVDAGHSPWRLDPVFVAQVFASLLMEPEGIVGDYPIAYDKIKIIINDGVDAIAEIMDEKSIAKYVYLERLVRQDDTGIWTVVGYDPAY